ncbi:hypothetical protein V7S43_010143 [Phytophthora oleae]|uniref:Uncharacterized protein n=1 Tax=Phytophthora oleae TaxID=2107226 RepID=A0ABD3FDE7_9STRA
MDLQNMLQAITGRQIQRVKEALTSVKGEHLSRTSTADHDQHAPRYASITKEVDDLIPSEDGKKLCLRFLSVRGCKSTKAVPCFSGRAHFEPESLHAKVKAVIRKRFGGIKPKYASL